MFNGDLLKRCSCKISKNNISEFPKLKVLLPIGYKYSVCEWAKIDDQHFDCRFRVKVTKKDAALSWINAFSVSSKTSYTKDRTFRENTANNIYKVVLRCHHNTKPKDGRKSHAKHTNCPAKLLVTLKKTDFCKNYQTTDVHLPLFPLIVTYRNKHNHSLDSADVLKYNKVSSEVKEKFIKYFKQGLTPSKALGKYTDYLKMKYGNECVKALGNGSLYPRKQWVYQLYYKVFNKKVLQRLKGHIENYNDEEHHMISDTEIIENCNNEEHHISDTEIIENYNDEEHHISDTEIIENYNDEEHHMISDAEIIENYNEEEHHIISDTEIGILDNISIYEEIIEDNVDNRGEDIDIPEQAEERFILEEFQECFKVIAQKSENNPELLSAVGNFVNNCNNLKTDSSLISALNSFGNFNDPFPKNKAKKTLHTQKKMSVFATPKQIGVQSTILVQHKTSYGGHSAIQSEQPAKQIFKEDQTDSEGSKSTLLPKKKVMTAPYIISYCSGNIFNASPYTH